VAIFCKNQFFLERMLNFVFTESLIVYFVSFSLSIFLAACFLFSRRRRRLAAKDEKTNEHATAPLVIKVEPWLLKEATDAHFK
jgi:hypothetical protein